MEIEWNSDHREHLEVGDQFPYWHMSGSRYFQCPLRRCGGTWGSPLVTESLFSYGSTPYRRAGNLSYPSLGITTIDVQWPHEMNVYDGLNGIMRSLLRTYRNLPRLWHRIRSTPSLVKPIFGLLSWQNSTGLDPSTVYLCTSVN
jgi:hypothetical protein